MTYLDTAIEHMNQERHANAQAKAEQAAREKEQREQTATRELQTLLEEFLSPEFREEVPITYRCDYESDGYTYRPQRLIVSARFECLGLPWRLKRAGNDEWDLATKKNGNYFTDVRQGHISSGNLQAVIIYELGLYQEEQEKREQERQAQEAAWQEKDRKAEAYEAQRKVEQDEWRAKATAEHERLRTLFDEERTKRIANLWQWVPGVTIEVYELEYCRGAIRDSLEDEGTAFDYVGGWTATSSLDQQGRITLESTMSYDSLREARIVQLIPEVHNPTWTVHRYSSMEELPTLLRHKVKLELEHVVAKRDSDMEYGIRRLAHKESLGYNEHWYSEVIGEKPLAWIRTLVEQAVQEEEKRQ